jgi:MFS family permease
VLGLGAESLIVAITTAIAKWFRGKELGFALGINLTIARLASVGADNSPSWASWAFYPHGTQQPASADGPLLIAVGAGVLCVLGAIFYFWIEKSASGKYRLGKGGEIDKLNVKQGLKFSRSYWYIVGLCITFYSAIFPFRTFAVKFLMHTHFNGLSPDVARESAGFFNSILPLSAMIATPLFGLLVDKVGRRSLFMMVGSVLLMPVYLIMAYTQISLWIPIIMMGISFSMIPAVMWPSVAYIVDEKRLGTGYALMSLIQQIGFFAFNWAIGFANDLTGAGESNPGGYAMGMWIFSILGFLGLFFSIMLRRSETGPHGHGLETIKV